MAVKVFLLGRPGSGKSTAARWIEKLVRREGFSAIRISDYKLLYDMFQRELHQSKSGLEHFSCAEHNGFNVVDSSILDTVLKEIERKAQAQLYFGKNEFILIEFARDDYSKALKFFDRGLLGSAYFLFFDADIDACIERIYKRIFSATTTDELHDDRSISDSASTADEFHDDHFVSEKIIRSYYYRDSEPSIIAQLVQEYQLDSQKMKIVKNNGSLEDFHLKIKEFADSLLEQDRGRKTDAILEASPKRKPKAYRITETLSGECPAFALAHQESIG